MNWLMTILFLVFMVTLYYVTGTVALQFLKGKQRINFSHKIIAGFIGISFLQWCVGFPAQLFHVSWGVYFWILVLVYVAFVVLCAWVLSNGFKQWHIDLNPKKIMQQIVAHVQSYWFIYVLVIIFSFFSMTSQLPYFEMNYDDHYYIGRIVQEIGANQLAIENYFTGSIQGIGFDRILTTYEIGYGFWAEIFSITPSFFARGTMVVMNYYLVFLSFHMLSGLFIKKKHYVQYGLIIITILVIPAGYLWVNKQTMMYDGWQFNTAVWYGSSIVRMVLLPILLVLSTQFLKYKKMTILALLMITCTMIGFSAIAIPIVVGFVMSYLFVLLIQQVIMNKSWKLKLLCGMTLLIGIVGVYAVANLNIEHSFFEKVQQAVIIFQEDNTTRLTGSSIFLPSATLALLSITTIKKKYRLQGLAMIAMSVVIFIPPAIHILSLSSMGYFFVIARTFTAIQVILLIMSGSFIVGVMERTKYIVPIVVSATLIAIVCFQLNHLESYKTITFMGSGISKSGYSVSRLVNNPTMIPKIYNDLAEYFETNQEQERYSIITPQIVEYESGKLHLNAGMIMTANNIEVCNSNYGTCQGMIEEEKQLINKFFNNDLENNDEFKEIILKDQIEYIIVELSQKKWIEENIPGDFVLESYSLTDDVLYLFKVIK